MAQTLLASRSRLINHTEKAVTYHYMVWKESWGGGSVQITRLQTSHFSLPRLQLLPTQIPKFQLKVLVKGICIYWRHRTRLTLLPGSIRMALEMLKAPMMILPNVFLKGYGTQEGHTILPRSIKVPLEMLKAPMKALPNVCAREERFKCMTVSSVASKPHNVNPKSPSSPNTTRLLYRYS